jgi:hypothetical protein
VSIGQAGFFVCPQTAEMQWGFNCNGNVHGQTQAPILRRQEFATSDKVMSSQSFLAVTSDGTVFFESRDALTPLAVNGFPNSTPGLKNVYEYRAGNVFLITEGNEPTVNTIGNTPNSRAVLVGAIGDGAGVLFGTVARLVPQDTDTQLSYYVARTDGGFGVPPIAATCGSEACRGAPSSEGTVSTPGTVAQAGTGNVKQKQHKKKRRHKHKRQAKHHQKKHRHGSHKAAKGKGGNR